MGASTSTADRPLRAVIYARYSSDAQSEQSIEDQVRICRARAEREGWTVGSVYADYAISGATAGRPQFQQLLADARARRFDMILAEALDRISRDQEHIAGFHKQVTFAGVQVITIAEGAITELHVGLKGTMSAMFLKDLAQKTHRGLEGRVRAGRSGGGLCYGYRVKRGLQPDGTPITGELEIDDDQAAVVRRIFTAYSAGRSPRAIAKQLNAEDIAGPRSGRWTASLLLGTAERENGLLRNRLYAGVRVWNRQRFIKDPSTGKRVARPNPREAWITTAVPQLAIIDQPLWDATQQRLRTGRQVVQPSRKSAPGVDQASDGPVGSRLAAARRPVWLLSGLVQCGVCNGPMTVMGSGGRLGCANHVERGICDNKRTVQRDRLRERVLAGLKERLLTPTLVEEFVRAYVNEVNAANRERGARQATLHREQAKLSRQIRNILELIKDGRGSTSMVDELRSLEQRQDALTVEISASASAEPVPALHPNLPEVFRRRVESLESALQEPNTAGLATEALRMLIDAILVYPGERRGEVTIALRGDLAAFLHLDEQAQSGNVRWTNGGEVLESLVAGTGFEPVTFRL